MPRVDHETWNSKTPMTMFTKLVQISTGIMTVAYSGADIRRMIAVDGDEIAVKETTQDPLAEILVDSMEELSSEQNVGTNVVDITPAASIAAIFDNTPESRALNGRLWFAYNLQGDGGVVGCLSACDFFVDDAFLTSKFTDKYIKSAGLPRNLKDYWFCDIVVSSKPPAGSLLLTQAYLYAARTKRKGLAMIAVTNGGLKLGTTLGMKKHKYKEGTLCYIEMGELRLSTVSKKLNLKGATDTVLTEICSRFQIRDESKIAMRC